MASRKGRRMVAGATAGDKKTPDGESVKGAESPSTTNWRNGKGENGGDRPKMREEAEGGGRR